MNEKKLKYINTYTYILVEAKSHNGEKYTKETNI